MIFLGGLSDEDAKYILKLMNKSLLIVLIGILIGCILLFII